MGAAHHSSPDYRRCWSSERLPLAHFTSVTSRDGPERPALRGIDVRAYEPDQGVREARLFDVRTVRPRCRPAVCGAILGPYRLVVRGALDRGRSGGLDRADYGRDRGRAQPVQSAPEYPL